MLPRFKIQIISRRAMAIEVLLLLLFFGAMQWTGESYASRNVPSAASHPTAPTVGWLSSMQQSVVDYVGAATIVVKEPGEPPKVDRGTVICRSNRPSVGGGCIPFGPLNSIMVLDRRAGLDVAFQVCIDNNGDGNCGGTDPRDPCADDVFFSHDDFGNFFNPLGPLPMDFRAGCPGGQFRGYVVFLCQGVHQTNPPHVHIASGGMISPASHGTGFGDFCQPEATEPGKKYFIR